MNQIANIKTAIENDASIYSDVDIGFPLTTSNERENPGS